LRFIVTSSEASSQVLSILLILRRVYDLEHVTSSCLSSANGLLCDAEVHARSSCYV